MTNRRSGISRCLGAATYAYRYRQTDRNPGLGQITQARRVLKKVFCLSLCMTVYTYMCFYSSFLKDTRMHTKTQFLISFNKMKASTEKNVHMHAHTTDAKRLTTCTFYFLDHWPVEYNTHTQQLHSKHYFHQSTFPNKMRYTSVNHFANTFTISHKQSLKPLFHKLWFSFETSHNKPNFTLISYVQLLFDHTHFNLNSQWFFSV